MVATVQSWPRFKSAQERKVYSMNAIRAYKPYLKLACVYSGLAGIRRGWISKMNLLMFLQDRLRRFVI